MTQSRGRGKRSAQDAANTRRNILNVAASCFAQAGFDRASVRDIAAEAGVSHGVLRHHFGSKADLWQAVMSEVFSEFQAKVAPLLADDSTNDAAERFRRLVRGFIEVTQSPSQSPTFSPSANPSMSPSQLPSASPSLSPTKVRQTTE